MIGSVFSWCCSGIDIPDQGYVIPFSVIGGISAGLLQYAGAATDTGAQVAGALVVDVPAF